MNVFEQLSDIITQIREGKVPGVDIRQNGPRLS